MKPKLLLQHVHTKFVQSTAHCTSNDYDTIITDLNNNLYKTYFKYNPTHIIFCANILTEEINQFINDFSQKIKVFLYHHNDVIRGIIDNYSHFPISHITNVTNDSNDKIIKYTSQIINTKLFNAKITEEKHDSIICFLDNHKTMPEELNNILYPKTKLPIKMFNGFAIHHSQNLGFINESDRAKLLQNNKYYLSIKNDSDYSVEATNCGCIVVSVEDLLSDKYTEKSVESSSLNIVDHSEFLKEKVFI